MTLADAMIGRQRHRNDRARFDRSIHNRGPGPGLPMPTIANCGG